MNKKEIEEKLKNLPKDKYIYQRYDGRISKYKIDKDGYIEVKTLMFTPKDSILLGKVSENIIDLIEEGDYVNGEIVIDIGERGLYLGYADDEHYSRISIDESEIESIVTKEQINQVKYEV